MNGLEMFGWVLAMWFVVRPLGGMLARRSASRAYLTEREHRQLTTVFECLGVTRVRRGLGSQGHAWNDCFLAYATQGRPFGLRPGLEKGWRSVRFTGLSEEATKAVSRLWDGKEVAFRGLAAAWLDEQAVATATPTPLPFEADQCSTSPTSR